MPRMNTLPLVIKLYLTSYRLRDLGYALSDGAEGALGAMVQAYKERKEIEDNEDMDYVGFFIDKESKTIPSNIEINEEPDLADLGDALKFLEELKPYLGDQICYPLR